MKKPKIFLSYVQEDRHKVDELYRKLSTAGFKPWMDKHGILAGENWPLRIQKAIRNSDFFLVCLSSNSVTKRSFFQTEVRRAREIWQEKLDSDIYLIPVRLDDCEVPHSLQDLQWVDFDNDGLKQLKMAIREGMKRNRKKSKPAPPQSIQIPKTRPQKVNTVKQKVRTAMKKQSRKRSPARHGVSGKPSGKGKNHFQKASASNSQIVNPNIWFKKHKMTVEIKANERVITNEYWLHALKQDVDLYRFKLRRTGTGKIDVPTENNRPLDYGLVSFGEGNADWEYYAVAFWRPLRRGDDPKHIVITYRLSDANHDAKPFHAFSYTDVVGCDKLNMSITFSGTLFPEIKVMRGRTSDDWENMEPEEVDIEQKDLDERTRVYSFEIEPERNVKYMVKWQPTSNKTANNNSKEVKLVAE